MPHFHINVCASSVVFLWVWPNQVMRGLWDRWTYNLSLDRGTRGISQTTPLHRTVCFVFGTNLITCMHAVVA